MSVLTIRVGQRDSRESTHHASRSGRWCRLSSGMRIALAVPADPVLASHQGMPQKEGSRLEFLLEAWGWHLTRHPEGIAPKRRSGACWSRDDCGWTVTKTQGKGAKSGWRPVTEDKLKCEGATVR